MIGNSKTKAPIDLFPGQLVGRWSGEREVHCVQYFVLCAVFCTVGNIFHCEHCVHSFAMWVMFCPVCNVFHSVHCSFCWSWCAFYRTWVVEMCLSWCAVCWNSGLCSCWIVQYSPLWRSIFQMHCTSNQEESPLNSDNMKLIRRDSKQTWGTSIQ